MVFLKRVKMLGDYLNIFILFMVVLYGFVIAKMKWMNASSNQVITKILLNTALPATILLSIGKDYTKEEFLKIIPNIVLPTLVIISLMVLSFFISKIIKVKNGRIGLFIGVCSMSSTIMLGIPITLAVYGSAGLSYALMTYASQTLIYWTIGLYILRKDSAEKIDHSLMVKQMIKEIFNMPLMAFFVGIFILLMGVTLPDFSVEFFSYFSGMTSGLAMLLVGSIIFIAGFDGFKFEKEIWVVIFFRFILAPLIAYAFGHALMVPIQMIKITILMVSLPIPNTTVILAEKYNIDIKFATESLTFSIAAYLIFLPVILFFMNSIS